MSAVGAGNAGAALLSARGIGKSFAHVEVLRGIDLDLQAGEVHALCGENGAGKSTFAKILAGVHRPSTGTLALAGEAVQFQQPLDAQRCGIALIHQEPTSFPDLSIAENLSIGRGPALRRVRWRQMTADAQRWMRLVGAECDVARPMRGLSIADQQLVEIARALASDSRLLLMDEPTAALTPGEVETLFGIVRRLRAEGRTVVFISHRLEEIRVICDRITVFRDGERIATEPMAGLQDEQIIRLMIGRPVAEYLHRDSAAVGEVALSVEELTIPGRIRDVSFELRRGEVVGLGGLVGAGRTDVAQALFGLAPTASGTIRIGGERVDIERPVDAIRHGIALAPEDRAAAGIFGSLSVEANLTAAAPRRIAPHGRLRHAMERDLTAEAVKRFAIRLAHQRQPIVELSGGNQQKVILARWLLTDPKILILDEPTRGIDIGVKAEFYRLIGELAAQGCAILLISSELPELLALSDRILVMCEGRLTASLARAEASEERIMQAAVPRARMHCEPAATS